jgi:hypothetical protein
VILKDWFPREKITCKKCLKSYKIHPSLLKQGPLWKFEIPDWSAFG